MDATAIVYTDGACSGNPGPGGWAWVALAGGETREGYGGDRATTNNRMELMGVIAGLEAIRERMREGSLRPAGIEVRTDSQYVKNGVSSWVNAWKRNGWRTASKTPVKNRDLWERLDALATEMKARFTWVEGHSGEVWNERCDALARKGVDENR